MTSFLKNYTITIVQFGFLILATAFLPVHTDGAINTQSNSCSAPKNFSSPYGTFQSPGHPFNYPYDIDCLYSIYARSGEVIQVIFDTLYLPNLEDTLTVYDGPDTAAPLLVNWSQIFFNHNSYYKLSVTGKQNIMKVHFVSPFNATSSRRFSANFRTFTPQTCPPKTYNMSSGSSSLFSPGYPLNYDNNMDCWYHITDCRGKMIELNFVDFFSLEHQHWDSIRIYNGPDATAPLIDSITTLPFIPYRVAGNESSAMSLHFVSGYRSMTGARRFSATFTCFDPDPPAPRCPQQTNYTDYYGTIQSPYYPNSYKNNQDCWYYIYANDSAGSNVNETVIQLTFDFFSTEKNGDFVRVYDHNFGLIEELSGEYEKGMKKFTGRRNLLMIHFISDGLVTGPGFSAHYIMSDMPANLSTTTTTSTTAKASTLLTTISTSTVLPPIQACPKRNYTAKSGTIQSPGFPQSYNWLKGWNCDYQITVEKGLAVRLTFDIIYIFYYDRLFIYDGYERREDALIKTLNNQVLSGTYVTSRKNAMLLVFSSHAMSSYIYHLGFSAHYTSVAPPVRPTLPCPAVTRDNSGGLSGTIQSPGYPQKPYGYYQNCWYNITAPDGMLIRLVFDVFSTENQADYVIIYRSICETINLSGYHVNGSIALVSSTNSLPIQFTTDGTNVDIGFFARYSFAPNIPLKCPQKRNFTQSTGVIQSPGYPYGFETNMECLYYMRAISTSMVIQLTFDAFSLGHDTDSCLIILDGPDLKKIARLTGYHPAGINVTSSHRLMTLILRTSTYESSLGFHARYSNVPAATTPLSTRYPYTTPSKDCGEDFYYDSNSTGLCYHYDYHLLSFDEAVSACAKRSATLVSIHSQSAEDSLKDYIQMSIGDHQGLYTWIGLKVDNKKEIMKWQDGTVVKYTQWENGQPDIEKGNCVGFLSWTENGQSSGWTTLPCSFRRPYVCMRSKL